MQLCGKERTGMPIKQLVVCIAGDEGSQVFVEDRDNWTKELIELLTSITEENYLGGNMVEIFT